MNLDTSNIKAELEVKNYKLMCGLLNEPCKTGNAKIKQMNEWKMFFDYEQRGHKFIIKEVYKIPKGKQSKRYGLISKIEELMLDLLVQDKHNGKVFLSKTKLYLELKMINENYSFGRYNIPKLSKLIEIEEADIHEFYDLSSGTMQRNVENSLNSLKNKSLIFWQPAKTVCMVDTTIIHNEAGKVKLNVSYSGQNEFEEDVYEYSPNHNKVKHTYREATEDEVKLIIQTERRIMNDFKCENKQEIFRFGLMDKFIKQVNNILFDEMNIIYYYDSYKILFNKEFINELWIDIKDDILLLDNQKKYMIQDDLNSELKNNLLINAMNRHNKAKESEKRNDKIERRSSEKYIENNNKLLDTLIDINHDNIKKEIRYTKTR